MESSTNPNTRIHRENAVQLAAPHTWPAAILPTLVATSAAAATGHVISPIMACVLLAICILMQASVNTFNDYYDFVKGTDSADDDVEISDATLVYNNVNPACALRLGIGFLVAAFLLGAYVIWQAGWIPLAIGVVGAVFVVVYSAGKTPVSYLPIGEAVSGGVMGGLIPLACYQALTGDLNWLMLLWAVPEIIGVGLIMMTNNTCDIEKDIPVGRQTLPAKLGREKASQCLPRARSGVACSDRGARGRVFHGRSYRGAVHAARRHSAAEGAVRQPAQLALAHWRHGSDLQHERCFRRILRCSDSCQFRSLFYAVK